MVCIPRCAAYQGKTQRTQEVTQMYYDKANRELMALIEEFLTVEREYKFAQSRANVHRDKAIEGDAWERALYFGALLRMLELEERAQEVEARINEIVDSISMTVIPGA